MRRLSPILLAALALSCQQKVPPAPSAAPSAAGSLAGLDTTRWVKIYDRARAANGYTLDLYRRQVPILFDMNGRVVHAWPRARVRSRVRLLADGSLLGLARGRAVVEYDWEGRQRWEYRPPDALPHHDVVRLATGNTLLVVRPAKSGWDTVLEVDTAGRVVWEWRAGDHLRSFAGASAKRGDVAHVNSVQELPPNPWFERGDTRFRPGNLLVSARNLNLVLVIDKRSGGVVWTFGERLDLQHEALMIGPGFPGHGHVLIFSNGYRGAYGYRRSAILEVAPPAAAITWEFSADGFFSPTGGVEQPLVNGNVLVTSTRGGRSFEITRAGDTVWEWAPPFDPTRSVRYAADHCPQLAALPRPRAAAVRPPPGYRHVDSPLYHFAGRGARRTIHIDGRKLSVLASNDDCRRLLLPESATLQVTYGVVRSLAEGAEPAAAAVRFAMRLEPEGSAEGVPLFAETVGAAGPAERSRVIDLADYGQRWVRLCVETQAGENPASEELAYWLNPEISAAGEPRSDEDDPDALTAEERQARKEHLRALGYID